MGIGAGEIILILIVFLLLFGAKRLPELAKSLGKSLREFKKATSDIQDEIHDSVNLDAKPKSTDNKLSGSAPDKAEPKG